MARHHPPVTSERTGTMKEFSCGGVVPGCDYKAYGETEADVLQKVSHHARTIHGMDKISPELIEKVRGNIKDN